MRGSAQSLTRKLRTAVIAAVLSLRLLHADDAAMPDGIAVVTSQQGSIRITDTSGKRQSSPDLHQARTLSGQTIRTGKDAHIFFALSNGLGIGIGEDSQVTFHIYAQEPFRAEKESLNYEPSVSTLTVEIQQGTFAIMSEGLSPLSKARLLTPTGTLRVHAALCLIRQDETGTTITAYKGNTTFHYPDGKNREFIAGPAAVRISPQSSSLGKIAEKIDIATLSERSKRFADAARNASRRVFFKSSETDGTAIPTLIAPNSYFEQAPARPYEYRE